jgi:hypothetical protein
MTLEGLSSWEDIWEHVSGGSEFDVEEFQTLLLRAIVNEYGGKLRVSDKALRDVIKDNTRIDVLFNAKMPFIELEEVPHKGDLDA